MSGSGLLNAAAFAFVLAVANTAAAWTVEHSRSPAGEMLHKASLPDPAGESVGISSGTIGNSFGETDFARKYIREEKNSEGSVFRSSGTVFGEDGSLVRAKDKQNEINAGWQPLNNLMVRDYLDEIPDRLPEIDTATMEDVLKKTEWEMFLNNEFRDMTTVDASSDNHSETVYGETAAMFTGILGRIDPGLKQVAEDVTGSLVEEMVDRRRDLLLVDRFLQGMRKEMPDLDVIRMYRAVQFTGGQMILANSLARKNNPDLSDRAILEKTADTFVDFLVKTEIHHGIVARAKAIADDMVERMLDGYDPYMDLDFNGKSVPSRTENANAEKSELIGVPFLAASPVDVAADDLIDDPFEKSVEPDNLIDNPFEESVQPDAFAGTPENTIEI